jgi:hypothetical protein
MADPQTPPQAQVYTALEWNPDLTYLNKSQPTSSPRPPAFNGTIHVSVSGLNSPLRQAGCPILHARMQPPVRAHGAGASLEGSSAPHASVWSAANIDCTFIDDRSTKAAPCMRQGPYMLSVEGPPRTSYTAVRGGDLLSSGAVGSGLGAAAQNSSAVVNVRAASGSSFRVVLNVSASEQARARAASCWPCWQAQTAAGALRRGDKVGTAGAHTNGRNQGPGPARLAGPRFSQARRPPACTFEPRRHAQDFAPRHVALGGAPCRLLRRQARPVPLSVSPAPAQRAGASAEAAAGPVFAYEPLVDEAGSPVSTDAAAAQLRLPQMTRAGSAAAEADQTISISNGQLIGVDGQPVTLKGINWCAAPPVSAHTVMHARRHPGGLHKAAAHERHAPC